MLSQVDSNSNIYLFFSIMLSIISVYLLVDKLRFKQIVYEKIKIVTKNDVEKELVLFKLIHPKKKPKVLTDSEKKYNISILSPEEYSKSQLYELELEIMAKRMNLMAREIVNSKLTKKGITGR